MSIRKTADIFKAISKFDDGKLFFEKFKKFSQNTIFEAPSPEVIKDLKGCIKCNIMDFI